MTRDNFTLESLAREIAACVRRSPEYRRPPGDTMTMGPFRLVGIVEGHAIVRRPKSALTTVAIKEFDTWTLTDKEGNHV